MSDQLEKAIQKQAFSQRMLAISKWVFVLYFVGVTIFFIASFFNLSRQLSEQQHQTQDYIKCIAVTLLKPVAQRNPEDFEKCAAEDIPNENISVEAPQKPTVIQESKPVQADRKSQDTSAPPDPEKPAVTPPANNPQEPTIIDNVQSGLQSVLDTLELTINNVKKEI